MNDAPRDPDDDAIGPFDSEHPPPLGFDAWAEISAALLQRGDDEQLAILEQRAIDVALWDACTNFWITELADQVARGNAKLAARYGNLCQAELQRRGPVQLPPTHALGSPSAGDLDATAFMTALSDQTALPFKSPFAALPFGAAHEGPPSFAPVSETLSEVGQTQEVQGIDIPDLPFKPSP